MRPVHPEQFASYKGVDDVRLMTDRLGHVDATNNALFPGQTAHTYMDRLYSKGRKLPEPN